MKCPILILTFALTLLSSKSTSLVSSLDFLKSSGLVGRSFLHLSKTPKDLKQAISGWVKGHLGHEHGNGNASLLESVYPEAAEAVSKRLHRLGDCFVPSIKGGTRVSLFEEPITVIVHNFLKAYLPDMESRKEDEQWQADLRKKVANLVNNLKEVAAHVIECLKGRDDPNFEPTKLALNRFSMAVRHLTFL